MCRSGEASGKKPVIVILGPTASGKTRISIELAKFLDTAVISADSMQVYKYMDIGTAKPDMEEMSGIRHYLMDEVTPDVEFSVARFQELAFGYIDLLHGQGRVPIVTGGTGLYIQSLVDNIRYSEFESNPEFREELKRIAEEKGNEYLYQRLQEIDRETASSLHVNDVRRVIRALEVFHFTGEPISLHKKNSRLYPPRYDFVLIGLCMDRQYLYSRIDRRVDKMLERGLVREVARLKELGYGNSQAARQGLGYKEFLSYFKGELTYDETVRLIKKNSRHYAKRQMTWFRGMKNIHWIDAGQTSNESTILENIKKVIASHGIF